MAEITINPTVWPKWCVDVDTWWDELTKDRALTLTIRVFERIRILDPVTSDEIDQVKRSLLERLVVARKDLEYISESLKVVQRATVKELRGFVFTSPETNEYFWDEFMDLGTGESILPRELVTTPPEIIKYTLIEVKEAIQDKPSDILNMTRDTVEAIKTLYKKIEET